MATPGRDHTPFSFATKAAESSRLVENNIGEHRFWLRACARLPRLADSLESTASSSDQFMKWPRQYMQKVIDLGRRGTVRERPSLLPTTSAR